MTGGLWSLPFLLKGFLPPCCCTRSSGSVLPSPTAAAAPSSGHLFRTRLTRDLALFLCGARALGRHAPAQLGGSSLDEQLHLGGGGGTGLTPRCGSVRAPDLTTRASGYVSAQAGSVGSQVREFL